MQKMPPSEPNAPRPELSFVQALGLVFDNLPGLVSDRVHLLALELRRAGVALGQMVALLVVALIAGLTAWFSIWFGVFVGLDALGMPWGWAAVLVVAVNGVVAWLAVRRATSMTALLKLPATMRSMTLAGVNPMNGRLDEQ